MKKPSKKIVLIALFIVACASVITYGLTNRDDEGVCSSGVNCINEADKNTDNTVNVIETSKYSVIAPEGVENESKTSPSRGGIVLNYDRPYGVIKVEIFNSKLDYSEIIQRGDVTETEVEIAGRVATQAEIDYSDIVRGPSPKNLICYAYNFESIPMPDDSKTILYISVLSQDDLSVSQITQFKRDAQDLIKSVNIK